MPGYTEGLPPLSRNILDPLKRRRDGSRNPSFAAHKSRLERLNATPSFDGILETVVERRDQARSERLPFVDPDGIYDTLDGTQETYDNHRNLTPLVQELLHYPDTREYLTDMIDENAWDSSVDVRRKAQKRSGAYYDVAILGTGPHGTVAATTIAEKYPQLKVLMIDRNGLMGGAWRNSGPRPAWWMNSRVRKADYRLPGIPRTPGSINPLGRYSTIELSDISAGNYALNTELGMANTVNAHLAAAAFAMDTTVELITDAEDAVVLELSDAEGRNFQVSAGAVISAPGIWQTSNIKALRKNTRDSPYYFATDSLYRHFGGAMLTEVRNPLEMFNDQLVNVVGGGDSALTAIEALLGLLPPETYRGLGPGRNRPAQINWIGAPGKYASEIDACLRSRYKNGIVQALPKYRGDRGAIINPVPSRAKLYGVQGDGIFVDTASDSYGARYIIDCTNKSGKSYNPKIVDRRTSAKPQAVYKVGPGAKPKLPRDTMKIISRLGISENTASLWALVPLTEKAAMKAAQVALKRRVKK